MGAIGGQYAVRRHGHGQIISKSPKVRNDFPPFRYVGTGTIFCCKLTLLRHKEPVEVHRGIGTIFDKLQVSAVKVKQKDLPSRIFHHFFRTKNFAPLPIRPNPNPKRSIQWQEEMLSSFRSSRHYPICPFNSSPRSHLLSA